MEWIDPKYADVMKALKQAQQGRPENREDDARAVRGFVIPAPPDGR
ncbi:hypothetical protein [Actinacidiphila paucisporea]|uniref:Uncharacterized protein n=1 Tax=Actinacidiphila paucisporea TaxID=310782 RepID=A0A1M7BUM8_9ACTN|nr:hypothetical protein [Actinacidiphila paucisporea]SHL58613.1 hypothetical protein SAMN05216499_10549 [Actinacidiphila paucisporea]